MSDETGEYSKGGSRIYRHQAQDRDWAAPEHADAEVIEQHVERSIGPIEMVYHEIISDLVHVDIYWVRATEERPFHVLVTGGMSAMPMTLPEGVEASPFAELVVLLPPSWPMEQEAWKDERHYWPIRWLKILARLPHEYGTWLGFGHTIPNGDPAAPFAPDTGLCGMLVLPSLSLAPEVQRVPRPEGGTIDLWTLWPLHEDEMSYKLREGVNALIDRMEEAGLGDVIDPARPSIVGPPPRKKLFGVF